MGITINLRSFSFNKECMYNFPKINFSLWVLKAKDFFLQFYAHFILRHISLDYRQETSLHVFLFINYFVSPLICKLLRLFLSYIDNFKFYKNINTKLIFYVYRPKPHWFEQKTGSFDWNQLDMLTRDTFTFYEQF